MRILGCEVSCDDTSIGIVEIEGGVKKVLSNIVFSQDHTKFGGVFPEYSAREHLEKIGKVYDEAIEKAGIELKDIDYISASYAPGLVGSLLVGYSFAKSLSYGSNIPFIPVHHLKGHIYAAFLENDIELPAISLVISGGHSSIIYLDEDHNFTEIGSTLDDAVGEAYDKVGRMLSLPYPAGRIIDEMSQEGEPNIRMPVAKTKGKYDFSFSGVKSFVLRYLKSNQEYIKEDVAASFQKAVEDALVPKTKKAFKDFNAKSLIVCGGVASNSGLRKDFKKEMKDKVYFPSIKLCLDNGAMIAAAAYYMVKNGKVKKDVTVKPNLKIDIG